MKIAIVGSGVSGLVAAYLLGREHEVSVFESNTYAGGHTHTVDVELDGRHHSVDTGFIVYNQRTYPFFCRLLDALGLSGQPADMSLSVSCERTGTEYATHSMSALFATRRNVIDPGFYRMLRQILRFNREARELLQSESNLTLGEYLSSRGYAPRFVDHYITPMGAAIWSAAPDRFLDFPASTFIRFFENHGLLDHKDKLQWMVLPGGSRTYVDRLLEGLHGRVHLGCPVLSARRRDDAAELLLPDGVRLQFDHLIMACHSDQALRLLEDRSEEERSVLGSIGYQENDVVLHTDSSVMPSRAAAWASWNYRIRDEQHDSVAVTYDMNRLQSMESSRPLLVTLNGSEQIDEASVLRRFTYHHPVFDNAAIDAQRRREEIDGVERTHFCGAYWGYGFHEDGVNSALAVCERFGVEF